ncbi:MFS transporter [Actinosynnema sp. NPDC002837]
MGAEPRAGGRDWLGFAVLALVPVLLSLDVSVLFLALPELSADLRPDSAELLWIGDIYPFMIAGFLVTMGTLGDRVGRKKLLLVGGALFGLASVLTAYSGSPGMLIAARALLGVSGAIMLPNTLALVVVMFANPKQRSLAIGVWISCFMAGIAVGPVIGGLVLDAFWWGAVFLVGVPVMVALLVLGPLTLPEFRNPRAGRIDLPSVVLSLAAILPVVYGLKGFARDGVTPVHAVALLVGLGFGAVFVVRQHKLPNPLLDLRLFGNRTFAGGIAIMLLASANISGSMLLASQYLQQVLGFSAVRAGFWLVVPAIGLVTASLLSPIAARRLRPGYVMAVGLAIATAGFAVLTQMSTTTGVALLVAGSVMVQFGIGSSGSLGTDLVVGTAPAEGAGSASSLVQTGTELGTALGIAGFGTVAVAAYRSDMAASPVTDARDTLPGALTAAGGLPSDAAAGLLAQAREAFTGGVTLAAIISTVILSALTVATLVLLRHAKPLGQAAPAAEPASTSGAEG